MSLFGWSYPPGCSGTPYDEAGAVDITAHCTARPADVSGVYWDEDGNLIESFPVTIPADPYAGIPEHTDSAERKVGRLDWDDELSEPANLAAAGRKYDRAKGRT